jgi:ribosomal-protein-alanine N-acetyltransferase
MKIQTSRLSIRQIEMTDDEYIFKAMECPQIHQMHSNGFITVEKVKSYIEVLLKEYQSGKYRTLAIAEKNTNKLIGSLTLDVYRNFSRAEISYWIDKNYRNIGYATETVKAMIEYCFTFLSLNRIQAMTSNPASERVLEKAGMIYEGTLRQYFGMKNTFWDCKMYSLLRSDFNPTK